MGLSGCFALTPCPHTLSKAKEQAKVPAPVRFRCALEPAVSAVYWGAHGVANGTASPAAVMEHGDLAVVRLQPAIRPPPVQHRHRSSARLAPAVHPPQQHPRRSPPLRKTRPRSLRMRYGARGLRGVLGSAWGGERYSNRKVGRAVPVTPLRGVTGEPHTRHCSANPAHSATYPPLRNLPQSGADIPVCARPRGQTGMSAPHTLS